MYRPDSKATIPARMAVGLVVLAAAALTAGHALAANHREAPITALDRTADITDLFAFVSYDDPDKATFILAVDPFLEPSNGPNYFPFDPGIVYAIRIDNDHDAVEDVVFEFSFETEVRLPGVFTGFVGAGSGIFAPDSSPAPLPPGTPIVPPAITALDGPGSEGLGLRQRYAVVRTVYADAVGDDESDDESDDEGDDSMRGRKGRRGAGSGSELLAEGLIAVPSNVGPRTMPDYPSLAGQGVHALADGIRVFAGTVDDPFWIDLGAAFDSLNFRTDGFPLPGLLTDDQDADDETNFAGDDVAGFNVNAIAIEVPIALLTATGMKEPSGSPAATIGVWGTTSRPRVRAYSRTPGEPSKLSKELVQIQRMGNPLINELIIGTGEKDRFSQSPPRDDAAFAAFALDPLLARVLNAIYGDALPVPDAPRLDLLPLVQYLPPAPSGPVADLLRLDTGVPPTAAAKRSRLGALGGDPAGFPNGRRVSDDVTDIAARVVVGVLAGPPFDGFPHNRIGDGVNTNDVPYLESFPYVGYAHDGRNSRHLDPGEIGGGPID